jgi:hypothetical protein
MGFRRRCRTQPKANPRIGSCKHLKFRSVQHLAPKLNDYLQCWQWDQSLCGAVTMPQRPFMRNIKMQRSLTPKPAAGALASDAGGRGFLMS